jgi:mannose-6-phosphate isomerase-like protein (cupin superfamily)
MIHKFYKDGEILDVAGLNEITVLIDRSETELTEIGWNSWNPKVNGPPHKHNNKEQIFYITDGVGKIKLGENSFEVKPGDLAYVPAGLVHQTIPKGNEPLSYMLFNVFNDPEKEGHATFADHIEKVKQLRKQQSESGDSYVIDEETLTEIKMAKFINNIHDGKEYDFGSNSTIVLLDRNETNRCELVLVSWPVASKGVMVAHKDKEQTFFILEGRGWVTVGNETKEVGPYDVVFVPRNTPHTTKAADTILTYLCMNSLIILNNDTSFDDMYKRVIPGRIKRWKSGDNVVGE